MPGDEEKTSITTQVDMVDLHPLIGAARPALVVMKGKLLGRKYDLEKEQSIIGRSSDAEISIKEDDISRHHARLTVEAGGRVLVEDLGSTNGTFVNKKKMDRSYLVDGDQLQCGNTLFKFLSQGSVDSIYHDELYRQATLDPLTRAANRKHFNQEIESEVSRARRYGRPLSLLLLDLDHFKLVNDTYGHPAGDYVLKHTSSIVKEILRAQDLFARYGGEEFAVVLPETNSDNAYAIAEKVRARIHGTRYEFEATQIKVTVSIGIASLKPGFTGPEDLVSEADKNLYQAKNAGRNRVVR